MLLHYKKNLYIDQAAVARQRKLPIHHPLIWFVGLF